MPADITVSNTVNLFHLAVDRRDWATARSCLAESVLILRGGKPVPTPADRFLEAIRSNVESFTATQHMIFSHHIDVRGDDDATCRAGYQNHHVRGDGGRWVLAGQQEITLRRTGGAWRITGVAVSPAWEEGSRSDGDAQTSS